MLRRKHKRTDHLSNESFSYSRVESSTKPDSFQEDSVDVDDVDAGEKPWSADEKKIFEDQMESLQDQLIATIMENQKLSL